MIINCTTGKTLPLDSLKLYPSRVKKHSLLEINSFFLTYECGDSIFYLRKLDLFFIVLTFLIIFIYK